MRNNISFTSSGLELSGHLYVPDGAPHRRPAIVVGHPASGVKEQAAGLYAESLARSGFVTLTFDAAFQGESEGLPRGLEDPAHRIEDLKAAVSFLTTRDEVDPDRIGMLGICASGGYSVPAAAADLRVRALATVSAVDIGRQFREGPDGAQSPAVLEQLLAGAAAARTAEACGEAPRMMSLFPENEQAARAAGQYTFDGWEYYCTPRAAHPRSAKQFTWSSVDRIATFDAFRFIKLLGSRPLLMVVGTNAVTKRMAMEAFADAISPKELFWVEGASHVDLYDKREYVPTVVAKVASFFAASMGA